MPFVYETDQIYYKKDGELLAKITFPMQEGYPCINHTYVNDALRGQGVAGKLMLETMHLFQKQHQAFRATCTYAIRWLGQHPEYHTLWIH